MIKIQRALISVSDKTGVLAFAVLLRERGVDPIPLTYETSAHHSARRPARHLWGPANPPGGSPGPG